MHQQLEAFVLTRQWRDTPEGIVLTYWMASPDGPLRVRIARHQAVMFVPRGVEVHCDRRRELELTALHGALHGAGVDAVYFASQSRLVTERDRLRRAAVRPLESDINPAARYLMERFITGSCRIAGETRRRAGFVDVYDPVLKPGEYRPDLGVMCIDIETDGESGPIVSLAALCGQDERVFMVGDGPGARGVHYAPSERALLSQFFAHVARLDPDALIGWNVVEFDLAHIHRRCTELGLRFALARGSERATVLAPQSAGQRSIARLPGRVALDGIDLLKSATYSFERFSLEYVAGEILGRGKRIAGPQDRIDEIRRLYREDKLALADYNLEDCRLVRDIFAATNLLAFAVERQRMTGLPMDRMGGSVAAFDYLYLPRLHRKGYVAGDIGSAPGEPSSPGGYVLPSQPGLYDDVLVLDFKSLYPSIIRTFKIDPLGLARPGDDPIEGFEGATFSRQDHILPQLLATLWRDRERAKSAGDEALSRAIKILMNSFYGVLGTPACRFFSPLLASSITRRGHEIIARSRDWITERGYPVIYGDTDSLFVLVGGSSGNSRSPESCHAIGSDLARDLNDWWRERLREEHRIESYLEMELEIHYRRFIMPTLRGSEEGSAKRYAGLVVTKSGEPRVVIKGLEAVRSDWTPLARNFQRELLRRVFLGEPVAAFIRDMRQRLFAGELDGQLVYHRRLRRHISAYDGNLPPHVRAARMLDRPVREVSYIWTTRGPEPAEKRSSPPSYQHYLERQLAPAADSILNCLGQSFDAIAGSQLKLF